MTHSDDSGLVLPPKVAPSQVVIVPVGRGKKDKDAVVDTFVDKMVAGLKASGIRYKIDDREKIQPGQKVSVSPRPGPENSRLPTRLANHCFCTTV